MKKSLSAMLLVLLAAAPIALAQASYSVNADVPFAFFIGGKSFPAGSYRFKASSNLAEITVSNRNGKEAAMAPVLTRLSPRPENDAAVVFDVAGNDHYLAEIYVPGLDGFQVQGAKGQHTHASVKAAK